MEYSKGTSSGPQFLNLLDADDCHDTVKDANDHADTCSDHSSHLSSNDSKVLSFDPKNPVSPNQTFRLKRTWLNKRSIQHQSPQRRILVPAIAEKTVVSNGNFPSLQKGSDRDAPRKWCDRVLRNGTREAQPRGAQSTLDCDRVAGGRGGLEAPERSDGRSGQAPTKQARIDLSGNHRTVWAKAQEQRTTPSQNPRNVEGVRGENHSYRQEQRNAVLRHPAEQVLHSVDAERDQSELRPKDSTDSGLCPPQVRFGQEGIKERGLERRRETFAATNSEANARERAPHAEQESGKDRVQERGEDRALERGDQDDIASSETGVDWEPGRLGQLCQGLCGVGTEGTGFPDISGDEGHRKASTSIEDNEPQAQNCELNETKSLIAALARPVAESKINFRQYQTSTVEVSDVANWTDMALDDHYTLNTHSSTVGKMLTSLSAELERANAAESDKTLFIEFACDPDSEIGNLGNKHGFEVMRCTLADGDLSQPLGKGMIRILDKIAPHKGPIVLHGALPCTPWSQIQRFNEHVHGPSFTEKLKRSQKKSLRMVRNFLVIAKAVIERDGLVSFEWPPTAGGWKEDIVLKMVESFGFKVEFHGCAVGVKARNGEPMKKPFAITTNNPDLANLLKTKQCKCTRPHVPCEGAETTRSGHYTPEMATTILKGHKKGIIRNMVEKYQTGKEATLAEIANEATKEEVRAFLDMSRKEQDRLVEAARKIHVNTGHRPPESLARLLRQKGAPLASRAAMERLKCSTCVETGRPNASPVVSLDTSDKPFQTIGIDLKESLHQNKKYKYLVLVDEASRLTRCLLLFTIGEKENRNATADEVIKAYETGWEELFGNPQNLRHDPEGALVSQAMLDAFKDKGVHLMATATEAHWQLGMVERMIATVFNTAEKVAKENNLEFPRAVALAVKSQNTVDRVRGYSPSQWAFGKQPSWTEDLFEDAEAINLSRDTSEAFKKKLELQISARNIFEKEQLNQKLLRAQRAQHRKEKAFIPGEICYVWRLGGKLVGTKKTGLHKGAWYGPGTILGTETKLNNGVSEPGAIIWVVMNDRLWRCANSHVRRGSDREVAEQLLLQQRPWTFENIVSNLQLGTYKDITNDPEPPAHAEMEESAVEPHVPMEQSSSSSRQPQKRGRTTGNGHRYPHKMPKNANLPDTAMDEDANWEEANLAAVTALHMCENGFLSSEEMPDKVVEIAFPAIENERTLRKYLKNPEAFVVTSLRKRKIEVNEKRLSPEEKELIRFAKGKEIREFIQEKVVTRLLEGEYVNPADIMKMRWILTWKTDPNEPSGKRGKARLVCLGFQDPYLGKEKTSAPTLTKRGKQLLLQIIVQREWTLLKGDVTAAFLQGRALTKNKYCLAPPELAEALGLPEGERVVRLLKSVYGLTAAPLEWYEQVNKVLLSLGFHRCHTDPTVWILRDTNPQSENICGIVGAHVDDFLMAGEGEHWQKCLDTLLTAFRWTPLEQTKFKQCGVDIEQLPNKEIIQSQEGYMTTLGEIDIKPQRAKEVDSPVTEQERTELRALLGGLQWVVGQTQLYGAVDVNLLQSDVTTATVQTLHDANKILRKIRQSQTKLHTRKIPGEVNVVGWSDASWANRKSGSSTGGYVIGLCGAKVLEGHRDHVTIVSWSTNKLKRVCRSSLAAEVQALAVTEDELHLTRLTWAEFNGARIDLNNVDEHISKIPGTAVIDAKSIYDTLTSTNQPLQLQEKRTALELLAYLQNTEANNTETRWVHGGANLADGLTKIGHHPMLREFLDSSTWALVQDPKGLSAKRRQTLGIDQLDDKTAALLLTKDRENFAEMAWEKLREVWPHLGQDSDDSE